MSRTIQISLTAAAVASVAMFVTDDAEARSFGGVSRGGFSRPAAFRAAPTRSGNEFPEPLHHCPETVI